MSVCLKPLTTVTGAANLSFAISGMGTALQSYRPYLAKWLEDNVPEGLAVLTLTDHHCRRLSTFNSIERGIQKKLQRRTSKVRVFTNIESLERFVSAVLVKIDDKWVVAEKGYIT